jgi:hypothetical protein
MCDEEEYGVGTHAVSPYMGLMPPASRPVRKRCMRTARWPASCGVLEGCQDQGQATSL